MPEVQKSTQSGEMSARFIEFVLMHSQNAALCLGEVPHPQTGKPQVNLEVAKVFIDQLEMIEEKTRGNLTEDESRVLSNALSNLRMGFVQATQKQAASGEEASSSEAGASPPPASSADEGAAPTTPTEEPAQGEDSAVEKSSEGESKKKFTKSYGS